MDTLKNGKLKTTITDIMHCTFEVTAYQNRQNGGGRQGKLQAKGNQKADRHTGLSMGSQRHNLCIEGAGQMMISAAANTYAALAGYRTLPGLCHHYPETDLGTPSGRLPLALGRHFRLLIKSPKMFLLWQKHI